MAPAYRVLLTAAFERSARRLIRKNPHIEDVIEEMATVLRRDPQNTTRRHQIKKLTNVEPGDGQWRIRSGVYRLRYDVEASDVILHSINHRSEAY